MQAASCADKDICMRKRTPGPPRNVTPRGGGGGTARGAVHLQRTLPPRQLCSTTQPASAQSVCSHAFGGPGLDDGPAGGSCTLRRPSGRTKLRLPDAVQARVARGMACRIVGRLAVAARPCTAHAAPGSPSSCTRAGSGAPPSASSTRATAMLRPSERLVGPPACSAARSPPAARCSCLRPPPPPLLLVPSCLPAATPSPSTACGQPTTAASHPPSATATTSSAPG